MLIKGNKFTTAITFPFTHQVQLFKHVLSKIKNMRLIRNYVRACKLDYKGITQRFSRRMKRKKYEKISMQLNESKIKISFYAAVRKVNNINFDLEYSLHTLIDHCYDLQNIELLLAIDSDDDIKYFKKLQDIYGKLFKFKLHISQIRYGYEKLHFYDRDLFPLAATSTRMLCDFSDDCHIVMKNFDLELLKIDQLYADNIYFIHTRSSRRAEYLGDVSQNMLLLFWIMQAKEPGSFFPIVSKRVLDIAQEFANKNDKNQEWSPIANAWICDCYVDILANYVKKFGADRIHHLEVIHMPPHTESILGAHQKKIDKHGLSPNNLAFIKMLSNETLDYLQKLSKSIVEKTIS